MKGRDNGMKDSCHGTEMLHEMQTEHPAAQNKFRPRPSNLITTGAKKMTNIMLRSISGTIHYNYVESIILVVI